MSEQERILLEQLEEQKKMSQLLQKELAELRIKSQIEIEKQKQEQWSTAINKIKEAQDAAKEQHAEQLNNIQEMVDQMMSAKSPDEDLATKLKTLLLKESEEDRIRREELQQKHRNKETVQLIEQHKALLQQASTLQSSPMDEETRTLLGSLMAATPATEPSNPTPNEVQQQLIEQLKRTLGVKETEDPQKAILRQFLTKSNTTLAQGGTTTLKPHLLKQLTGEEEDFNMADWLSRFNQQDQGESKIEFEDEKYKSSRSGILDKATSNIQHKEVWPQKNLLEDWADEDISFNQMLFEHLVAGEARTIELCTEPAQILTRLRLLRRLAYAKLRGYEWSLIRKMYAAHPHIHRSKGKHMGRKL